MLITRTGESYHCNECGRLSQINHLSNDTRTDTVLFVKNKKKYIALILDILSFIFEFIKCTGNIKEDIIKEQQRKTRGQEVIFRVVASFSIRQA